MGFVWKVCLIVHCHHKDIVVGSFIFKVDNTRIEHKRVLGQLWDWNMFFFSWKSHCKLPAALTQMHLPVGFHPTTAAFHLTSPSMTPFLVFQHYGPLEDQKVWLSLSLDKLSNEFSITWQWHRVYTMEPIPRPALSMPVTLVLERSEQYSRMVSSEFGG